MGSKTKSSGRDISEKAKAISIRRFLITYFILMNVFIFFYMYKPILEKINISNLYNHFIVVTASKLLNAVGFPVTHQGFLIILPNLSLDVKFGCNGLEAVMIYAIAVMAYPAHWKRKLVGIAAGLFVIQAANFLRMIMLVYAGLHMRHLFDYIHLYIAQGVMIALALGVFFLYLRYVNEPQKALG